MVQSHADVNHFLSCMMHQLLYCVVFRQRQEMLAAVALRMPERRVVVRGVSAGGSNLGDFRAYFLGKWRVWINILWHKFRLMLKKIDDLTVVSKF